MTKNNEELADLLNELDPPYESQQELSIGRVLDRYGIPFFYQQPMIVYDQQEHQVWHPSFTLPSYGGTVIDYIPSSLGQNGHPGTNHREQVYQYNQIPAVLLGPQDLMKDNWDQKLYCDIKRELDDMYTAYKGANPSNG